VVAALVHRNPATTVPAGSHVARADPRYAHIPPDALPDTESLADVRSRLLPYWYDVIAADLYAARVPLVCDLSNYLAHSVRIIWPGQAPTTRTSRAASMASGVMVSRLLMVMMRATWFMRRSTRRKLPPVMRMMVTIDSESVGLCGS
jgi:hypothetical protein